MGKYDRETGLVTNQHGKIDDYFTPKEDIEESEDIGL